MRAAAPTKIIETAYLMMTLEDEPSFVLISPVAGFSVEEALSSPTFYSSALVCSVAGRG